jgi:hypothetical protein
VNKHRLAKRLGAYEDRYVFVGDLQAVAITGALKAQPVTVKDSDDLINRISWSHSLSSSRSQLVGGCSASAAWPDSQCSR